MRIMVATLLAAGSFAAAFAGSGAFAQSATTSYPYCLLTGPDQECTFSSMAQCMASRRGNADFCEPNTQFTGSRRPGGRGAAGTAR